MCGSRLWVRYPQIYKKACTKKMVKIVCLSSILHLNIFDWVINLITKIKHRSSILKFFHFLKNIIKTTEMSSSKWHGNKIRKICTVNILKNKHRTSYTSYIILSHSIGVANVAIKYFLNYTLLPQYTLYAIYRAF